MRDVNHKLLVAALSIMTLPAVASAQHYVYISRDQPDGNAVVKVETSSNTVVATLPVDVQPGDLAVTPDGGHLYVTNPLLNVVYAINTGLFTLEATVPVGNTPFSLSVTSDGRYVYVLGPGDISVLRTADNTVVDVLPTSYTPVSMVINGDGSLAYIADGGPTLHVLRTADNTFLSPFTISGASLGKMAVSPAGPTLYAIDVVRSKVWFINYDTGAVMRTVTVPIYPISIVAAPDGSTLYVTDFEESSGAGVLLGISLGGTILRQARLGFGPNGIALSYPDGRFAYVGNSGIGPAAVVETSIFAVRTPLPPAPAPFAATQPSPYIPMIHYQPHLFFQIALDEAVLKGTFSLGPGNTGLGLPESNLTLEIADFGLTIPANSFQKDQSGGFTFTGRINNANVQAVINPGVDGYNFSFQIENLPLKGVVNPVTARMIVGKNIGGATVNAKTSP